MRFIVDTHDLEVSRSMVEILLENELGSLVTVSEVEEKSNSVNVPIEEINETTEVNKLSIDDFPGLKAIKDELIKRGYKKVE